jgi:hypothetical protein
VRAAFLAMELTVWYVIVPLALAALLTGLVMSLGTPWGLFRHYWVIITLVLTILTTVIVLLETRTISYMAAVAASGADPRELPGSLPHSVGGLIVLLVITGAERIQAARPNPVRVAKARGRASKAGATERSLTVPASLPTEFSDRIFKGNQQIN